MTALRATDLIQDAIVDLAAGPLLRGNYLADPERVEAARWDVENQARFEHEGVCAKDGQWCDTCERIALANLADAEAGR